MRSVLPNKRRDMFRAVSVGVLTAMQLGFLGCAHSVTGGSTPSAPSSGFRLLLGQSPGPLTVEMSLATDSCSDKSRPDLTRNVVALGSTDTLAECISVASSQSSTRCRSACWYRTPSNDSLKHGCFCHTDYIWMPQPNAAVDSARIVWPCEGPASCSYNGVCPQGSPTAQCACHAGWRGPACGELDLQPVDKTKLGYRALAPDGTNVSSWGMPVLWDGKSGKWHGWASEMVLGCGINAWETNSQVVHTVSDSPFGPFRKVGDPVWPVFAHEPDVVRGPNGEWVMMYSAFPYTAAGFNRSACTSCKNGTTPPQGTPGCPFQRGNPPSLGHNFKQMLAVATTPDGPWREVEITQLTVPWDWNTALTINTDNSAVALIRAGYTWHADNYSDPTTWHAVGIPAGQSGEGPGWVGASIEDPYLWKDSNDVYATPTDCPTNWTDGTAMNWTVTGVAYGNVVNFTDGTSASFPRRERPHIIWSADGSAPLALSNGVQITGVGNEANADGVMSLVQPLGNLSTGCHSSRCGVAAEKCCLNTPKEFCTTECDDCCAWHD